MMLFKLLCIKQCQIYLQIDKLHARTCVDLCLGYVHFHHIKSTHTSTYFNLLQTAFNMSQTAHICFNLIQPPHKTTANLLTPIATNSNMLQRTQIR